MLLLSPLVHHIVILGHKVHWLYILNVLLYVTQFSNDCFFAGEVRRNAREKQRQKFMSQALSHNTSAAQLY